MKVVGRELVRGEDVEARRASRPGESLTRTGRWRRN